MPLFVHRSNHIETLHAALARVLSETASRDPFEPAAVVVGSQGMARWLRYEFATRDGVAARMEFPFSAQALDGAIRWLTASSRDALGPYLWSPTAATAGRGWSKRELVSRVVGLIRAELETAPFERVRRYLRPNGSGSGETKSAADDGQVVQARELTFAGQVADVLDRLLHDRHEMALAWSRHPEEASKEYRWLAVLLRGLLVHEDPASPARLLEACESLTTPPPWASRSTMCLFGLSTLGAGDRARVRAIAQHIDVHLFLMVPSDTWWQHIHSHGEQVAALRAVTRYEDYAARIREYESQNPLLASLGMPSRDVQFWLEEVGYEGDEVESREPLERGVTWLNVLQSWIRRAETRAELAEKLAALPPPDGAPDGGEVRDPTLGFHATFGPMRQCEVLRDLLLERFEADPSLEPRHILVMTPDVDTYGPLISAVFARTGVAVEVEGERSDPPRGLPAIPVSVSDRGLTQTNAVAEVMLLVLRLCGERVTGGAVLDLCGLEPVRRRFGVAYEDLETLRELVVDSNMRWAFNADDRARFDQPALDSHTLRFGLERLALGALMPDETMHLSMEGAEGEGVDGRRGMRADVVGVPLRTPEQRRCAGVLAQVVSLLADFTTQCATPSAASGWRRRLEAVLSALTETSEDAAWLSREVRDRLQRFEEEFDREKEEALSLSRDAVYQWLKSDFEIPQRGDRAITGAVTLCALQPMRSVPFRVVALLGMDDGTFPRGSMPKTWDPFGERLPGERDNREIDRHLLLEAMLSARDHLLVLWSGFDVRSGERTPAAVPVEEILEVLTEAWTRAHPTTPSETDHGTGRLFVRAHPLQPWGLGAHMGATPRVFDARLQRAAAMLEAQRLGEQSPVSSGLMVVEDGDGRLPPEPNPPQTISLRQLAMGLQNPQRLYLSGRLGMYMGREQEAPAGREPLGLESLERWSLKGEALSMLTAQQTGGTTTERLRGVVDALYGKMYGEGRLPLAAGGKVLLAEECEALLPLSEAHAATRGDLGGEGVGVSIDAGDLRIVGTVQDLRMLETAAGERLLHSRCEASSVGNVRRQLMAWLTLLAGKASGLDLDVELLGPPPSRSKLPYAQEGFSAPHMDAGAARAQLVSVAKLWMRLRCEPLPLFGNTSRALAAAMHSEGIEVEGAAHGAPPSSLVKIAVDKMTGGYSGFGDLGDAYTGALFGTLDVEEAMAREGPESLRGLSAALWLPFLRASVERDAFEKTWRER
jgi:exodeoxyribonuclease V gamma subunit